MDDHDLMGAGHQERTLVSSTACDAEADTARVFGWNPIAR